MPDKGSSGASLLHHELSVVVVDLSSQQLFHCPSHFLTSSHHPSDVVAGVIPLTLFTVAAMPIRNDIGVLHDSIISFKLLFQLRQLFLWYQRSASIRKFNISQLDVALFNWLW